ncbi:MAG: UbiA family prenyltransferase [Phycisphaerae bacterium]
MFRLLALLQLTRAALAFTAVADAWAVFLLAAPGSLGAVERYGWVGAIGRMVLLGCISVGLYGFGMVLNDLMDVRRDRVLAPRRPLPSGRLGVRTALVVAVALLMMSLSASVLLSMWEIVGGHAWVPWGMLLTMLTVCLIVAYDAATKYFGALGLLTLGLIRAVHCLIGNVHAEAMFLPMFLFTHVLLISVVCYRLEHKRPRMGKWDVLFTVAGLVGVNGFFVALMYWRGGLTPMNWGLLYGPALVAGAYLLWALFYTFVYRRGLYSPRELGGRLMVMGLFWLFVYDAGALLGNRQWLAGMAVIGLWLCALGLFFGIRALAALQAGRSKFEAEVKPNGSKAV